MLRPPIPVRLPGGGGRDVRALLSDRAIALVALTSFVARLPKGVFPIALVLLLNDRTGGFATAGAGAAGLAIGDAASAPWQGKWVDRSGRSQALLLTTPVLVAATVGLLVAGDRIPPVGVVGLCVLMGVGTPPVSGSVKTVWSTLAPGRAASVYRLEALLLQGIFAIGPLLVALLVVVSGPSGMLVLALTCAVVGTVAFVWVTSALPDVAKSRRRPPRGALRVSAVRVLVVVTVLQGVMLGALPVAVTVVAIRADMPALVGILQAVGAVGGLAGSLIPIIGQPARFYVLANALLSAVLLVLLTLGAISGGVAICGFAVVLAVRGLLMTPITAASYVLMDSATDVGHRAEAFTWMSSGLAVGVATGSAAAGWLIDIATLPIALSIAPVSIAIAAVAPLLGRPRRRRLQGTWSGRCLDLGSAESCRAGDPGPR